MSRGFGAMQRAILQALDHMPALRVPWEMDGSRPVPPDAAGQLVDVYSVRTLQTTTAWVRGEWCTGPRFGRRRIREAPSFHLARQAHLPHSCWRQREYASFSRALHRLVAVQALWPVMHSGLLWVEPTIALTNAHRYPHWEIDYVVKCLSFPLGMINT